MISKIKIIFIVLMFSNIKTYCQVDSSRSINYKFHLNIKPQVGYSLIFGINGWENKTSSFGDISYELGIVKTSSSFAEDGIMYTDKYFAFSYNKGSQNNVYGFIAGISQKAIFFDFGASVNYFTDFMNERALTISPLIGLSAFYVCNIDAFISYDIYLLKNKFDIFHWRPGIRLSLGVLEKENKNNKKLKIY